MESQGKSDKLSSHLMSTLAELEVNVERPGLFAVAQSEPVNVLLNVFYLRDNKITFAILAATHKTTIASSLDPY
jgi:hypothetical protein